MIAAGRDSGVTYLDLERPSDLAKLTEPEIYLERQPNGSWFSTRFSASRSCFL